jgi:hypothetical protein
MDQIGFGWCPALRDLKSCIVLPLLPLLPSVSKVCLPDLMFVYV